MSCFSAGKPCIFDELLTHVGFLNAELALTLFGTWYYTKGCVGGGQPHPFGGQGAGSAAALSQLPLLKLSSAF